MKVLRFGVCFYFILTLIKENDVSNVMNLPKSTTEFGLNLLRKIGENSNDNIFISPLSVQMALTLVLQGAKGLTANELKTLLYSNDLSDKTINEELHKINILLNSATNENYSLNIANRLYLQYGINLKNPFQSIVQKYYAGGLDLVDFIRNPKGAEKTINSWVSDQTNGKIPKIVSELTPDTILIIINAIYFKGDWNVQFDEAKTKVDIFTTPTGSSTTVNMMLLLDQHFYYGEDKSLNCKIIELPYKGEDLSMFIILPNEDNGLYELEKRLDFETLDELISYMDEEEISILKLPRLKLDMEYKLIPVLKSLGLESLFSSYKTDLSAIYGEPGQISVSDVIHKTFIEINEKGSEAAAATSIHITNRMGGPNRDLDFIVNRPFIFFIRDNRSNLILFLGRITNPGKV